MGEEGWERMDIGRGEKGGGMEEGEGPGWREE